MQDTRAKDSSQTCLSEAVERKLSLALLLCAVAFGLFVVWPLMEFGYSGGGDDVVHMAYNHEARAILGSLHKLFGWSYLFGFGAPIFLFRPPLQYACVAMIQAATFGLASLNAIHKLFYVCGLSFFPVGIYYLLHKLRFRPLACAAAALFAITPISMWGHTLDAYFRLGVAKQLIAIFIFPFALGKIHGAVKSREAVLPASLLTALCFLSHPYMAYCLGLVCALYGALVLFGTGPRAAFETGVRLFLIWGLAGLLLAFYLAPFYSSPEIQMLEFSSSWRHAFEVVCMTTAQTVNSFLQGGLFDTTRWFTYGGGEWGWQDNTFTGRWPVLTALCLFGLVLCVRRRRCFNHFFVLSIFLLAFVMFLGPDDMPWLVYLPFQEQYQYIHGVFLLDLAAVCLAGIAAGALLARLADAVRARALARRPDAACRAVAVGVCMLGAGLIVFMPWKDRLLVAEKIMIRRNFDTSGGQLAPRALKHEVNRDFKKIVDIMRAPGYPGRFYGSAQGSVADRELFYFTILPALCERTNLICGFFSAEVGGINKLVIEQFRPAIPLYRNLVELFNVRYLVCAAPNSERLQVAGGYATLVERNAHWVLWRTRGKHGHFSVLPERPYLVYADRRDWTELCRLWLQAFKDAPEPRRFPHLVKAGPGALRDMELPDGRYAGLILPGSLTVPDSDELQRIRAFAAEGGHILSAVPLDDIPHAAIRSASDIDFAKLCDAERAPAGTCEETVVERERHAARIELAAPAFVMFKTAYYRGWTATVDGRSVQNVEVGPGFNGVFLPAGEHELTFRYRGPNHHAAGKAISLAALLGAVAITLVARRRRGAERRANVARRECSRATPAGDMRSGVLTGCLLLAVAGLGYLYFREQFMRVPVTIRPARNETVGTDIRLDWNPLNLANVAYEVEIDDESPEFRHVVYHRDSLDVAYARKHLGLMPDRRYWWRARSVVEGIPGRWAGPIPFATAPGPAPARNGPDPFSISPRCRLDNGAKIAVIADTNLPEGTHLYVRVCRADNLDRLVATEARVAEGAFSAVATPPAGGWPEDTDLVLHCDCNMITQRYPAAAVLGNRGQAFAERGLAPAQLPLRGLFAETGVLRTGSEIESELLSETIPRIHASLAQSGELTVEIHANLPDNALLTVQVFREYHVDPIDQSHVEVRDGKATARFKVAPGPDYRAAVRFSPDMQYPSVRRLVGEEGEKLSGWSMESGGQLGLRRVFSLSDLVP